MSLRASDRLIAALDFTRLATAMAVARQLRGVVGTVKVGSVLFTAAGPAVIARMRSLGFAVMLDLKFIDIPTTVELSCRAAVHHRVAMLTVHTSGGAAMVEMAVRGVRDEARRTRIPRPLVLGVTVLTSTADGSSARIRSRVAELAALARRAGCDGVVASAQEAAALRRRFGPRLRIVCPGIRPAHTQPGDQRRVCTPAEALRRGADFLVVGRPITAAAHPALAAQCIIEEMEARDRC